VQDALHSFRMTCISGHWPQSRTKSSTFNDKGRQSAIHSKFSM